LLQSIGANLNDFLMSNIKRLPSFAVVWERSRMLEGGWPEIGVPQ
jgi:hypothetical protein